ncbi:MAG: histidine kinase dimerization/phospho-acceptor domain-containing protein, partial [Miltoncostaeaceae bacterium]
MNRLGHTLGRIGLQGWLVATLLAVGTLASLAVLLVVLPTLESSVRQERAQDEQAALGRAAEASRGLASVEFGAGAPEVEAAARAIRAETRGNVRIVYRPSSLARFRAITVPDDSELFETYGEVLPRGVNRIGTTADRRAVFATIPFFIGREQVGAVQTIVPVAGAESTINSVQRRVFIAVILVLALAALAGYGLARLIGRRIAGLAGTAADIAGGDLTARAMELPPRELATLGDSLNQMAGQVEELVAELTDERDRAQGLIASLAEGVVAVSAEGEVAVANAAGRRYLALGDASTELGALPPEVADAALAARAGENDDGPRILRGPRGHELEVSARRLGAHGAGGVVLTLRDVTEERRLERARRELVANVSHELKTPVAALRGFLELLESQDIDPGTRDEFLASMTQETLRLQRLVEEQLQLARLDAGALPLDLEPVDVGELVSEVVASRAVLADGDGVGLSVRLPPLGPVTARIDGARVEQVILILIDNALR